MVLLLDRVDRLLTKWVISIVLSVGSVVCLRMWVVKVVLRCMFLVLVWCLNLLWVWVVSVVLCLCLVVSVAVRLVSVRRCRVVSLLVSWCPVVLCLEL